MKRVTFAAMLAMLAVGSSWAEAQEAGRITRIEFRPATRAEGGGVFITLVGSGSCSYMIDFGDGQSEKRTSVVLPDRMRHTYGEDREYLVASWPARVVPESELALV